jgi:hypothetical protein
LKFIYSKLNPDIKIKTMITSQFLLSSIVDLNSPGHYFTWSIITISVANLALIVAMLVIFGLALLLPFGKSSSIKELAEVVQEPVVHTEPAAGNASMLTFRLRRYIRNKLTLDQLIPDKQPAYVASWVYVFGVATLAALGIAIVSGFLIALGGVDWWHTNEVGHFFNSLHLWSVEAFMAFMVIHLWGKFWMAAWRGKRAKTWMTGVLAFLASIVEAFTGYLSQQNFDSQWISTNGKDAFNAAGVGSFFNLMNFGQMILWHVVLIPIVLVFIVGIHVLLVRIKGVVTPIETERKYFSKKVRTQVPPVKIPYKKYDIIKEGIIASTIVTILVVVLSVLLSSPDMPPVTIKSWATIAPADFLATAANELAGSSETATYGPPYNNGDSNVQSLLISWQKLAGVHYKINPADTFVINPLKAVSGADPLLKKAIETYTTASSSQQNKWDQNYIKALEKVSFKNNKPVLPKGDYGPVAYMLSTELTLAQNGAIDADLLANRQFYGNDFTKPLLFMEDGQYFSSLAAQQHLIGSQWGVMNETGSYPGQPWLWLYSLWYQVPGFKTSPNVDLIAIYLTGICTVLLLLVPFIPGLRDIPRIIPIHKLVWRDWYKNEKEVLKN